LNPENQASDQEYLNISNLTKGMFQIKLEGDNWAVIRKLIKE